MPTWGDDLFNIVVDTANNAARTVSSAAAGLEGTVNDAVSAISSIAAETADKAKRARERDAVAKAESEKAAYEPKVQAALDILEGSSAIEVVQSLGDSPLPMTEGNANRVKSSFPIPREQTLLWADVEFDLRPSGIAATDKGVFIKSDAAVFPFGGIPCSELNSEHAAPSKLSYFLWEYFDPAWFACGAEGNVALTVDARCCSRFVEACNRIAHAANTITDSRQTSLLGGFERDGAIAHAATVSAAETLSSETAVFTEQKAAINVPGGHGEMAEKAGHILDVAQGKNTEWIGPGNAKNGADRIVDGILVQTKFYKAPRQTLESCFDSGTGLYRYLDESGNPMQLEVAKDQYERVLGLFKLKIEQGKVPGVSDPNQAGQVVRKSNITYQQAVNLAKPGTIESLLFDAATGSVICGCAFGISFLSSAFISYRKTGDIEASIRAGMSAGVQVFGISFVQHIVVSQLSRTGLANALMTPSRAVVEKLGYKSTQTIVNGIRALAGKPAIGGAAASKQLAKMLRSNVATAAVTFAFFSIPDTYKLALGRASGAQYAHNMVSLAASIAGGAGGAAVAGVITAKAAGAAGTAVAPGVGTAVGIAGGFVGGVAVGAIANAASGILYEGDGATIGRLFNAIVSAMAVEYMLDAGEIEALVELIDNTSSADFQYLLEEVFAAEEQEDAVRSFLTPRFDEVVLRRARFMLPEDSIVADALLGFMPDEKNEEILTSDRGISN